MVLSSVRRWAGGLALALALGLVGLTGSAPAAPTIEEFGTQNSYQPIGITAGPDGDLWFVRASAPGIVRSTPTGSMTEFTENLSGPALTIVTGPDGNLWFTEQGADRIGKISRAGAIEEFPPLPSGSEPVDIVAGPDGNLWFTEKGNHGAIARITPGGTITPFHTGLMSESEPIGITAGPAGDLWFTDQGGTGAIGKITTTGTIEEFSEGLTANSRPVGITAGPEGDLWFTESANPGRIGRITTSGTIAEYTAGLTPGFTADAGPLAITSANDGNIYFTEPNGGKIGEITPSGTVTEWTPPTSSRAPEGIATGPDGNVWFTDTATGKIGVLTVAPKVSATTAADVAEGSATLQASVDPNSQASTYEFQYGTTSSYGFSTSPSSVGSGAGSLAVSSSVNGLSPDTEYHFRAVATNGTGTTYGPEETFTTEASPVIVTGKEEAGSGKETVVPPTTSTSSVLAPPAPVLLPPPTAPVAPPALGRTAVAQVLAGSVLIRLPGARTAVALTTGDIPIGSLVDAEHGTVLVTTALNGQGLTQPATVWGGSFVLQQSSAAGGMTTFVDQAPSPGGCPAPRHAGHLAKAAAKRHEASTTLWSKDDDGHFSTRGQNSVATVRGTYWGTRERCDGTLTTVRRGLVSVRSLHTHRTVLLSAGHSYLARP
jgi:streptogramin lyase